MYDGVPIAIPAIVLFPASATRARPKSKILICGGALGFAGSFAEEQIFRFQVAVHDARFVRRGEHVEHRRGDREELPSLRSADRAR